MSTVLRPTQGDDLIHWCPGCEGIHVLPWKRGGWTFDGNMESPTFQPSFLHRWPEGDGEKKVERVCHYVLTAGVLNFQQDCTHALASRDVPLPPIPDAYSNFDQPQPYTPPPPVSVPAFG